HTVVVDARAVTDARRHGIDGGGRNPERVGDAERADAGRVLADARGVRDEAANPERQRQAERERAGERTGDQDVAELHTALALRDGVEDDDASGHDGTPIRRIVTIPPPLAHHAPALVEPRRGLKRLPRARASEAGAATGDGVARRAADGSEEARDARPSKDPHGLGATQIVSADHQTEHSTRDAPAFRLTPHCHAADLIRVRWSDPCARMLAISRA